MHEVPSHGIEARRWTVVFHRRAENWFFSLIALGHFKHVSAFAWLPEFGLWVFYDVGFRRTRIMHLADGVPAHATIAALVDGNEVITIETRNDSLPLIRLGMFCTTAVAHLVGIRSSALRPDAFYRVCQRSALRNEAACGHLVASGGVASDDEGRHTGNSDRPEPCDPAGAGAGVADLQPAE